MLILLVLSLMIGAFSFHVLHNIRISTNHNVTQQEHLTRPAAHITVQTLQCRRYEKDMFLNLANRDRFENYFVQWANTVDALTRAINNYRQNAVNGEQILIAEQWFAHSKQYQEMVLQVVHDIRDGHITSPSQANMALAPHKNIIRSLTHNSFSIFDQEFAQSCIAGQNLQQQTQQSQQWIGLLLAMVVVVSLIALVTIPRRIVHPLRTLEHTASQLRDGDLTARLSQDFPGNELGRLGMTFNEMADQIELREEELIKAKAHADSLNQAKTSFLMNMSHEVRTPLTTILGFAEFLDDASMVEESIEAITHSGQHLLRIVDDLLQLTEIETNQIILKGDTFGLGSLIESLVEELEPRASEKNLELIYQV